MSNSPFNECNGPGGRFISVDSERIAECMDEWRAKKNDWHPYFIDGCLQGYRR